MSKLTWVCRCANQNIKHRNQCFSTKERKKGSCSLITDRMFFFTSKTSSDIIPLPPSLFCASTNFIQGHLAMKISISLWHARALHNTCSHNRTLRLHHLIRRLKWEGRKYSERVNWFVAQMGIVHHYHLISVWILALILKERFYRLSNIKEGCRWTDLLLRLNMTRAIHHVLKCSTAPREVGVLPASLKARGAGLQLLTCPGFGAAEVPPACLTYSTWQGMEVFHPLNKTSDSRILCAKCS